MVAALPVVIVLAVNIRITKEELTIRLQIVRTAEAGNSVVKELLYVTVNVLPAYIWLVPQSDALSVRLESSLARMVQRRALYVTPGSFLARVQQFVLHAH